MKEPKRLLSHGATDFERQLLRSVVSERPSALLRSRMQRGLGLIGPLAWASNVKALFGTVPSRFTLGMAVIGMVVAGGFAAVRWLPSSDANDAVASSPFMSSPVEPAPAQEPQPVREAPSAAQPPPAVALPEATRPEPAARAEVSPTPAAPSEPSAVADDDSQLREEIALLDAARAALQGADRDSARATLSVYRQRFPSGILRREAKVLWGRADEKSDEASSTDE